MLSKALSKRRGFLCHSLAGTIHLLTLLLILVGCGADVPEVPVGVNHGGKPVDGPSAALLHETGVDLFASGLASDDIDAIVQAIDLLEQAALTAPYNNAYWLDLADAYMNSGLATEYPNAIDTYWMLYEEGDSQADALLARLVEAYQQVGNQQAAFDVASERLKQATEKQSSSAGLQLTWLAFTNGQIDKTTELLVDKADDLDKPGVLLLLASSLKELTDDNEAALDLIEDALDEFDKNSPSAKLAEQIRARLSK